MKYFSICILIAAMILNTTCVSFAQAKESEFPYYLEENCSRYETYQAENPNMPYDKVVAYVNANVDRGCYNELQAVLKPESIDVLVNKSFVFPDDHEPSDLVTCDGWWQLREEAAEQFMMMRDELKDEGLSVYVHSAYRSYYTQMYVYNNFVSRYGKAYADTQSARPGHSEHQSGLAIDMLQIGSVERLGYAYFENSEEYAWLIKNAHKYGFILRYPKDYSEIHGYIYEPWHWRYVGIEIASQMFDEGITTLEEYFGKYLAPAVVEKLEREQTISPVAADIEVDGRRFKLQSYVFNDYNYFRIRDIAYILNGSQKQFALTYNDKTSMVQITCSHSYVPTGTEMQIDAKKILSPSIQNILISIDEVLYVFSVYTINDYNYIRLGDLGEIIGFTLRWDNEIQMTVITT